MNYKFIWPLAFVLLAVVGCNKKDASTTTTTDNSSETAAAPEDMTNSGITNTGLSDEAKKAAQTYTGQGSPTALFFHAEWCPACRAFKPTLEEVQAKYPSVKVIDLNVDKQKEITKAFKITSIPSLFFFDKSGKFVESTTGGLAAEKLEEEFNKINDGSNTNKEKTKMPAENKQ